MSGIPAPQHPASGHASEEPWTIRRLLGWIETYLESREVDSPRVCAQMLLAHVLQCERLRLYMDADRPVTPAERQVLRDLVQRAGRHEPVQYLVGETWFWSKRFRVGPATLIPRPCTEQLVDLAVERLRQMRASGAAEEPLRVLEIGTGTGCIATCIALALRGQTRREDDVPAGRSLEVRITATDLVAQALDLARANAQAHGVADVIEFVEGNLYAPLAGRGLERGVDLLVSNPPYVADDEWDALAPNVREYEPRTALAGGAGGMDVLGPLLAQAHRWLRPGGGLIVEIGHAQHERALAAARTNPHLHSVAAHQDFEGFWRVVTATAR